MFSYTSWKMSFGGIKLIDLWFNEHIIYANINHVRPSVVLQESLPEQTKKFSLRHHQIKLDEHLERAIRQNLAYIETTKESIMNELNMFW